MNGRKIFKLCGIPQEFIPEATACFLLLMDELMN